MKSKSGNWLVNGVRADHRVSGFSQSSGADLPVKPGMVTLIFCQHGKISILNKDESVFLKLSDNQHNIYFNANSGSKIRMSGSPGEWLFIQFSRKSFLSVADETHPSIKQFVERVRANEEALYSESNLMMETAFLGCINSILNCNYPDPVKRMYVFSKAVELFVLQVEAFNRPAAGKSAFITKEYDRERILFARDYLVRHMENPPSLSDLARLAGINEFKLKKGFKEVFNQPVFAYLADVRLETARNELMKKSRSVTEIAFELGFSSPQHFSAAFKRKFGVSPGKIG